MADKPWKVYERKVAKMFGYERALQKGTKTKEDAAPPEGIEAARWVIDAKLNKTIVVWSWMAALVEYAKGKNKPAILVFRQPPKHQSYAVVEKAWFFTRFHSHLTFFKLSPWSKQGRRDFNTAWGEVKKSCGAKQLPGLLMGVEKGSMDYVCIKAENLISLMTAKGMLKGETDDEV